MERDEHLQRMAKICGMPESETMYRIIECAMTSEEARFIVELGQIVFVALIVLLNCSFRRLQFHGPRWAGMIPGYAVGALGAYGTIQRTVILIRGL